MRRLASGAIAAIALRNLILTLSVLLDLNVLGVFISVLFKGCIFLQFKECWWLLDSKSLNRRYYRSMPLGIIFGGFSIDSSVQTSEVVVALNIALPLGNTFPRCAIIDPSKQASQIDVVLEIGLPLGDIFPPGLSEKVLARLHSQSLIRLSGV